MAYRNELYKNKRCHFFESTELHLKGYNAVPSRWDNLGQYSGFHLSRRALTVPGRSLTGCLGSTKERDYNKACRI